MNTSIPSLYLIRDLVMIGPITSRMDAAPAQTIENTYGTFCWPAPTLKQGYDVALTKTLTYDIVHPELICPLSRCHFSSNNQYC